MAQEASTIIINELAWAGSTASSQDEWIELKNTTNEDIDLTGWQLTRPKSATDPSETQMMEIEEDTEDPLANIISAGGFFLIANNEQDRIFNVGKENEQESVLNVEPNLIESKVSLLNDKLLIKLYDGQWDDGREPIDVAGNGGTPLAGNNSLKISMERDNDGADWHDALTATNLDEGVTDLGTPWAENSVLTPPPTLESVQPAAAINDAVLEIEEIRGTNFSLESAPTLKLVQTTQEITASNLHVVNATLIDQAHFNIEGAEIGEWDLVLINPDGKTATLPNAITISEPEVGPDLTTTIRIYEIYPRPSTTSNDEFIELYNFGDTTIDLNGWQLDDVRDGGSNPYVFENKTLAPESFLVLYKPQSRLTLNDSGDSVSLIQPNGFVLDEIAYETAERGKSLARFDNGFEWTETITPNGENVLTQTTPEEPNTPPLEPEDEPEPAEDTPESDATPTYKQDALLVTELLPNPTDTQEEFIEIFNNSTSDIALAGWKLRDASGKSFTIGEDDIQIQGTTIIRPNQFVFVTQTSSKIHLNNSGGETIELISPDDVVITSVSYPDKAPAGASYSHFEDGAWTWTSQPTPGKINVVILEETIENISTQTVALPSVGTLPRQWFGIGLMSLCLASMLVWYKLNNEIP
jgi:hypothetical protein